MESSNDCKGGSNSISITKNQEELQIRSNVPPASQAW